MILCAVERLDIKVNEAPVSRPKGFDPIPADTEETATKVVEAAFRVHRALGPGLLESVYEACMCRELAKMGVPFEHQVELPVE